MRHINPEVAASLFANIKSIGKNTINIDAWTNIYPTLIFKCAILTPRWSPVYFILYNIKSAINRNAVGKYLPRHHLRVKFHLKTGAYIWV